MMARLTAALVLGGALAMASAAHAQPAGPPMGFPSRDVASMLLAHTGELKLSDPQVTRLAAIARRTAERRQSMRASLDSVRPVRDSVRRGPPLAARAFVERMRDQTHTDLRDALSVLTADQQATAWEMVAARGGGSGRMGRGMRQPMPQRPRDAPRGQ